MYHVHIYLCDNVWKLVDLSKYSNIISYFIFWDIREFLYYFLFDNLVDQLTFTILIPW